MQRSNHRVSECLCMYVCLCIYVQLYMCVCVYVFVYGYLCMCVSTRTDTAQRDKSIGYGGLLEWYPNGSLSQTQGIYFSFDSSLQENYVRWMERYIFFFATGSSIYFPHFIGFRPSGLAGFPQLSRCVPMWQVFVLQEGHLMQDMERKQVRMLSFLVYFICKTPRPLESTNVFKVESTSPVQLLEDFSLEEKQNCSYDLLHEETSECL